MINKANTILKQFNPLESTLIKRYFELCTLDNTICNLWSIDSKILDDTFNFVRNIKIPMYENNSSFRKILRKYQNKILVA